MKLLGLQAGGLSRTGGPASEVAHSPGWHISIGCWWEASVPMPVHLSSRLLERPHTMVAGTV